MTERMEPAELNRRLAELFGVELGAHTASDFKKVSSLFYGDCEESIFLTIDEPQGYTSLWQNREGKPWQSAIEAFHAAWRRDPPHYAEDLQTAFGLGELMKDRKLHQMFSYHLHEIVSPGYKSFTHMTEFKMAHASAYDRALAAFRAMGGESKTEDDEASCHADRDGECSWSKCPNLLPNGERNPDAPHCVLDVDEEE